MKIFFRIRKWHSPRLVAGLGLLGLGLVAGALSACRDSAPPASSGPAKKPVLVYTLVGKAPPSDQDPAGVPSVVEVPPPPESKPAPAEVPILEMSDDFCREEVQADRVFYVRNSGGTLLIPCVCNEKGDWVKVPNEAPRRAKARWGSGKWPCIVVGDTYPTADLPEGETKKVYLYR